MRGTISTTLVNAAPPAYGRVSARYYPHRRRRQTQSDLRERQAVRAGAKASDSSTKIAAQLELLV
jgi:hypothetical protein